MLLNCGGAGIDTADYSAVDSSNGLNVDLGLASQQVQNNGYVGKDTLISIEKIIGTKNSDIIIGKTTNLSTDIMTYELGAGNDTIWAGSGTNIIYT